MGHLPHLSAAADGGSVEPVTAHPAEPEPTRPRRAELVAALSLALDLGLGQPMEHMLRAAVIATRLADRVGLDAIGAASSSTPSCCRGSAARPTRPS